MVSLDARDNGFMEIKIVPTGENVLLYLPILKRTELDTVEGFQSDALYACNKYVPQLKGITDSFEERFSKFSHADTINMLRIFNFVRSKLMYGIYDSNNPGHLLISLQCFGGWWAGVASQIFNEVLLEKCEIFCKEQKCDDQHKIYDMMMSILACICKAFGCSARTPLIPHMPQGGTGPDPVAIFADSIINRYPAYGVRHRREELIKALKDWHIPKYVRRESNIRQIWLPYNHIDRTALLINYNINHTIV
jgi:hypothetical protein